MTDAWWLPTVAPTEWDESWTGAGRAVPSGQVNLGGGHTIGYVNKNQLHRLIAQLDLFGQIESIGKHVAAYLDVIADPRLKEAKADARGDEVAGVRAAKAASKARHPAKGAPAKAPAKKAPAKKAAPRRPRLGA
jgi:hypothetical protein